ncbi:MAG: response regulator [Pontiellaceae bacterium]|nr:response regulator [Pontiellaceae bacterium]MBN2783755.1 response regulator [Pontiellaceae bacterium]
MGKKWTLETRLGIGYALGALANALLLAAAVYGFSLVSDPFFFYFSALFLLLVAFIGYLAGRFVGRRISTENEQSTQEMRDQLSVMQELTKANEFLESETLGLKKHRKALLSIMEDAERYNLELKREIADRKRAESEAAQARNNLELILHGGDLGYWNWDIEDDSYTFNERSATILGCTYDELESSSNWRIQRMHEDDLTTVQTSLAHHLEGKSDIYTCEYRMKRNNNEWIWVLDRGRVIERSKTQAPLRMVGTLLDITDRKKYELETKEANRLLDRRSRELEENQHIIMGMMEDANDARESLEQANRQLLIAREKAEQATRAKSDFLASMSHEIRTPMNGIIGTASLMRDTTLTDEQKEYLRIIQTSGDALLSLLNDILDFSKIEAGKLNLEPRPFDLREICEHITELLTPTALEKGIDLVLRFSPDTPACVVGDGGRIRQVLMNLIGNALKFTREGHVYINIDTVAGTDKETTINFLIEDTGIGISREELPLLFQKFSQADSSTTREFGGTGLGLAICKQLVALMGGKIGMESELGKGSTFWFRLNLPIAQQKNASMIDQVFFKNERVLVIDEKRLMGRVMAEWMNRWGLKADQSSSIDQSVEMARENSYQIILMEEHLAFTAENPFVNNPEFEQQTLFIICSITNRDFRSLDHAGLATNLVKPIRLGNLLSKIAKVLGYTLDISTAPPHPGQHGPISMPRAISTPKPRPEFETVSSESSGSYSILIVEDNLVNQTVAKRILTKEGFSVDVAGNGEQAVDKIAKGGQYDLIFMDCQMPRMDGYQASERIRDMEDANNTEFRIPIIALTANAMQGDREKCIDAGMNDYVAKPVKKEALLEMIRRHLG